MLLRIKKLICKMVGCKEQAAPLAAPAAPVNVHSHMRLSNEVVVINDEQHRVYWENNSPKLPHVRMGCGYIPLRSLGKR